MQENTSHTHRIRNWCFGTVVGAMIFSITGNLISDSIPNPFNFVVRVYLWITGQKEQEAIEAPQPKLELFLPDQTTPLKNAIIAPEVGVNYEEFKNGLSFPVFMLNSGNADTGPLRFTYYLDPRLPRPEGARNTKESGYGCELPGAIGSPSGGNLMPGNSTPQQFGLFFGSSVAKPSSGTYKFLVRIRSTKGDLLSETPLTLRIQ